MIESIGYLIIEGWHWSKALAWNESGVSRDIQFNIYTLKGTKKLNHVKIYWKYETCGSRAQNIKQWKSYRESILKFPARTFWNMALKTKACIRADFRLPN